MPGLCWGLVSVLGRFIFLCEQLDGLDLRRWLEVAKLECWNGGVVRYWENGTMECWCVDVKPQGVSFFSSLGLP